MKDIKHYIQLLENYRWRLCKISALEAELRKIRSDIDEGISTRDSLDPDWENNLNSELKKIKSELQVVDDLVESIPQTRNLLPCKLYLRLHYIAGYSLTETAVEMNISRSTLRRIRQRCEAYFGDL